MLLTAHRGIGQPMRVDKIDRVIENPSEHIGKLCHVAGWPVGCVFKLVKTDGEKHTLVTPKTGRVYDLNKPLLYTRKQMEELSAKG